MKPITKMKYTTIVLTFNLLLITFNSIAQNVGINATGAAPDNSALLDLSATNKGFLITRADTASIVSPAFGLMTLAPTDSCLYMYSGSQWIGMGGAGKSCSCNCASSPPTPTFPCGGTVIPIVDVTNPTTGKIWMDRNLGASQVATSSTDAAAYGDLYQWGRCSDGHEKRTSTTTNTLSVSDTPAHGNFITINLAPNDWRNPQNNTLWQGVAGINNPCPTGYRIPTKLELDAERLSWLTNDAAGAFASVLKLSLAGWRLNSIGLILNIGNNGYYWSSTVNGVNADDLAFFGVNASINNNTRAIGASVRCIKD
jgi:uncharacterized protein (TIGR02145 family)